DRLPEHAGVVEDDVDADELLEDGEADADPDDRQQAVATTGDVAEPGLSLSPQGLSDLRNLRLHPAAAQEAGEHLSRLVKLVDRHEIAGRFGDLERADQVDDRRDHL